MADEKTNRELGSDAKSAPSQNTSVQNAPGAGSAVKPTVAPVKESAKEVPKAPAKEPVKEAPKTPVKETANTPATRPSGKKSRGSALDALIGMLSFFTIFRINIDEKHIHAVNTNFWLAPMVGLITGLLVAGVGGLMIFIGASSFMTCAMMLATAFLVSKFLHFDGLVDFGDGMVATGEREKKLRALKDTNIGAGGLGLALTIVIISLAGMNSFGMFIIMLVGPIEVLVKNTMVATAAFGNPGNGMAAEQVRCTSEISAIVSSLLSVILCFVSLMIIGLAYDAAMGTDYISNANAIPAMIMIGIAVLSTLIMGYIIAVLANWQFGFVNGDVLGASNEISRALLYVVIIAAMTAMGKINVWI